MKLFLKVMGIICLSIIAVVYLAFLFLLPKYDINQYKPELQKLVNEQAKLNLNFDNAKIVTTPLLGIGVKLDNISVTLPDESSLFSAESAKVRLAIPSLFLLTVKVSCAEIEKPFLNIEILDDKAYKVMKIVEELMDNKEVLLEDVTQEAETKKSSLAFNPEWIRVKVPCIKLKDYKILVNDLKSKHFLKISGDVMRLGYFNGKVVKFATNAKLFSDENENINANIAIDTFIPPAIKLDEEDDKPERLDINFVNPVTMYRNYDLKSDIDVKLRVRKRFNNIISFGHANIDGLTLKISQLQLPESYFHFKTKGFWADINSDINVFENEKIAINGKLNYSRHPKTAMTIKTDNIYFNDMVVLARAILDSLHIKHDFAKISMDGFVNADTYIKTNFKKLNSTGNITVQDGALTIRGIGKVIDDFKALIVLDNNILEIKDTSLNLAGANVIAGGKIDEKSVVNINIDTDRISLPVLFNAFAPNDVKRSINLKSGDAGLKLVLKGKLDKAVADLALDLRDFNIADRANTFSFSNNDLTANFICDKKDLKGDINASGIKVYLPQTKSDISVPKIALNVSDSNIEIPENSVILNGNSKFNFKGNVKDYTKIENVNFALNGKFLSSDLTKLIGNEYSKFLNAKGSPSLSVLISGNPKKQTLNAEILADSENYFTPVNIQTLQGKTTAIRSTVDFKKHRIKIKDTGIYIKDKITDEKGNVKYAYNELLGIDGTVAGNNVNLLKINIPQNIKGSIQGLNNSNFTLDGHLNIFGDISSPHYRGNLNITWLSIPDLMITSSRIGLGFKGKELAVKVEDLLVNGSDFNVNTSLSLVPSSQINITGMNVKSNYVDADKLIQVSDKAMKLLPQTTSTPASTSANANIPLVLRNGHFSGKALKSGDIETGLTNTDFSINNNILVLNNLSTKVFDGTVKGNISMNLISSLMQIKLSGNSVNVDKMLLQAAAMKDTLSGKADFTTDISLKGTTYEQQVKSLKGVVDFEAKDGQFGPFGKLENLIIAENIRESQFFQTTLGGVINSLTQIDTTHFDSLTGHLNFEDGIVSIDPIISKGSAIALKLFGDMDILANKINTKAQAKMTSSVANILGPINAINPINIMNAAGGMNVLTAKAFTLFCEAVPEEEMAKIPEFDNKYIDANALKFQLGIRGDLAKPLTLVKSFKWLALASDMEKAENFVELLPVNKKGEDYVIDPKVLQKVTKEELKQQAELAKQQIKENAKQNMEAKKQEIIDAAQQTVDAKIQEANDKAQQKINAKIEEGKNSKAGKFLKTVKDISDQLDAISTQDQTQTEQAAPVQQVETEAEKQNNTVTSEQDG